MRTARWTALLMCFTASVARAGDTRSFDVDHLQVSTAGGDFLATESAGRSAPWELRAATFYRYLDSPLRLKGGTDEVLVGGRSLKRRPVQLVDQLRRRFMRGQQVRQPIVWLGEQLLKRWAAQ